MKSRVLYFPYIRIPENAWLTQMLLYWDQVSSIVPYDYVNNPESLGSYMLDLVREELVHQIIPDRYIHDIPKFRDSFLDYLESLGSDMDRRRKDFRRASYSHIHIEKMGPISDALVHELVAQEDQYPWFNVEKDTADDFMSYLATTLGQIESIESSPVTDNREYLQRLTHAGVLDQQIEQQLESIRIQVLEEILPIPRHSIEAHKIRAFKDKHARELRDFRFCIERELIKAASITDPTLRQRELDIFFEEAIARIEEIQESMRSAGWETAKTALSVVTAIPGASPILGLLGAVIEAVTGTRKPISNSSFAYAAYANIELAV